MGVIKGDTGSLDYSSHQLVKYQASEEFLFRIVPERPTS